MWAKACLLLIIALVVARALLWFAYEPIVTADTESYVLVAAQMEQLDLTNYVGDRPPGYPLLLLVGGRDFGVVRFIQSILGIATALTLFAVVFMQTRNMGLAFLVALLQGLSLGEITYEACMLSEVLSTFLLTLLVLVIHRICRDENAPVVWVAFAGFLTALAGLTRPVLLFLFFFYLVFLGWYWSRREFSPGRWRRLLIIYAIPALVPVLALCVFNKITVNYFGVTTFTGYNLTRQSGAFIEYAPDEYSTIRDIYLQYREKRYAMGKTDKGTIWEAGPEIRKATGLSFTELSKELTAMSLTLFVQHPGRYFRGVCSAWLRFWEPSGYLRKARFASERLKVVVQVVWRVEKVLLLAMNVLFLLSALLLFRFAGRARQHVRDWPLFLHLFMIILIASVLQAMVEYGSGRFAAPFQPLIRFTVLFCMWIALHGRSGVDKKGGRSLVATRFLTPFFCLLGLGLLLANGCYRFSEPDFADSAVNTDGYEIERLPIAFTASYVRSTDVYLGTSYKGDILLF